MDWTREYGHERQDARMDRSPYWGRGHARDNVHLRTMAVKFKPIWVCLGWGLAPAQSRDSRKRAKLKWEIAEIERRSVHVHKHEVTIELPADESE